MRVGAASVQLHAANAVQSSINLATLPPLPPSSAMDVQSLLATMHVARRSEQSKAANAGAESARFETEQKMTEAREALKQAEEAQREAEEKSGIISTLETVATVAAAVVAVASVVCTAGASAPAIVALAGVALSTSSSYVAKENEDLGMACALGGAALSLGAGFASSGAAAAEAAQSAGGTAMSAGEQAVRAAARAVSIAAKMTQGTARLGQGVMIIKRAQAQSIADDKSADAKGVRADATQSQQKEDDAIELLRQLESSNQRAVAIITQTAQSISAARAAATANIGRKA